MTATANTTPMSRHAAATPTITPDAHALALALGNRTGTGDGVDPGTTLVNLLPGANGRAPWRARPRKPGGPRAFWKALAQDLFEPGWERFTGDALTQRNGRRSHVR